MSLADDVKKGIYLDPGPAAGYIDELWEYILSQSPSETIRLLELERDFHTFRSAVLTLKRWGRSTFPGIYFTESPPLPVNPINSRILSSQDVLSAYIRGRWRPDPDALPPVLEENRDGMPVEIQRDYAIDTFSRGLGDTADGVLSGTLVGLIRFTVHSVNSGYRVHSSPTFWKDPHVFGRGKLSTPVDDVLGAADYKFGGDLDGNIIWDNGIHTVSRGNTQTRVTKF
jgi:hypothetical protein